MTVKARGTHGGGIPRQTTSQFKRVSYYQNAAVTIANQKIPGVKILTTN